MNGLYQRKTSANTNAPVMQTAVSQGAAGGIPRGTSISVPQQGQGIDAARLGGLLGMIRNGTAKDGGDGVFNPGVMPGVGQSLALGGGAAASSAGNPGAGVPSGGMGLGFDPSKLAGLLSGMGFGG